MSWSIVIPPQSPVPEASIAAADVDQMIAATPNEPEYIAQMEAPDSVRAQVAEAKVLAAAAVKQSGYERVRVFLSGHATIDGRGDSFGVTICRG